MELAQLRQSMNTMNSKKRPPIVLLGVTSDAPSTASNLSKEQGLEPHLHHLHLVEVVFKLEEILFSESIPTSDDLRKSQQQQNLSSHLLLQIEQWVSSLSEAQLRQTILAVPKDY